MTYLEAIIQEEQMQLEHALELVQELYQTLYRDYVEFKITKYKHYEKVLEVRFNSYNAYININMNSTSATIRELLTYLFTDKCQGLITHD